ncbi:SWIM zinc finger family protein [Actinomadura madurae]|uniref:SWIM zinc finger family protein n=2 Tax=Actinomadura madurae TaxID=1993 RepID=UPI0020275C3F|nr:SWIM zinc finger family protein [Actinomadura madurae]MCP9965660.1 SWIM zinc finger domain-containing protein [Actinomadura madurae]MCP9978130.1 SWIM zinc finger domain-containing protein [Actinomadura madurae]URM94495.1 SWIM zinc finger domain-containing protein [Actinomadura madurae]URN05206.1 SWIM zinc finger domain-containing protein [Actinomadura madurae]
MASSVAAGTAQAYTYTRPSGLDEGLLGLSTSGGTTGSGPQAHPYFFSGVLTQAAPAAAALLALADVAQTRYFKPRPTSFRDPVVTCNGDRIRMESFSACGGVYARLDVLEPALDGEVHERGTTNVDVNGPLREALARVGGSDPLHLAVGTDELAVTTMDGAVVEKKVPLPDRWLRGFAEVQVITAGFDLRGELKGPDAVRFLRSLPRGSRGPLWAVPAGRTLRVTSRPAAGAVCLAGPDRLRTMLPLLRFARALRVYGPSVADGGGPVSSVWELEMPGMRYVLTLSPQHSRGFSGEGAVLDALSTDEAAGDADLVGALLSFEPRVEPDLLAERSGLTLERTKAALVQLGTSGRVGFDAAEAAFFHRELPYDPARVAGLNPRLRSARKLVEGGAVRFTGEETAVVVSNGGERQVRFEGDRVTCTCPWWFDHRGERGPCKHALAARMVRRETAVEAAR